MKKAKNSDKQAMGHDSGIKGLLFEQKAVNLFSKEGWTIETRKHMNGGEIDIYGEKEPFLEDKKFLLVECKDKDKVTKSDVTRFMKKVLDFHKGLPEDILGDKPSITAIIVYSGAIDLDAKDVAESFKPKIGFKQL